MVCDNTPDVYVDAVFAIEVQEVNGASELSHLNIDPVIPLKVSNPLVVPGQIVVPPLTFPPTDPGFTVTVVVDEFAEAHAPFCTTARNRVVCESAPDVYVAVVFVIEVQEVNGATELSQLSMDPVLPLKVSNPLVNPGQIVVPPVTAPPVDPGLIVTVVDDEFAGEQEPL